MTSSGSWLVVQTSWASGSPNGPAKTESLAHSRRSAGVHSS
jgi:hypothetical protein